MPFPFNSRGESPLHPQVLYFSDKTKKSHGAALKGLLNSVDTEDANPERVVDDFTQGYVSIAGSPSPTNKSKMRSYIKKSFQDKLLRTKLTSNYHRGIASEFFDLTRHVVLKTDDRTVDFSKCVLPSLSRVQLCTTQGSNTLEMEAYYYAYPVDEETYLAQTRDGKIQTITQQEYYVLMGKLTKPLHFNHEKVEGLEILLAQTRNDTSFGRRKKTHNCKVLKSKITQLRHQASDHNDAEFLKRKIIHMAKYYNVKPFFSSHMSVKLNSGAKTVKCKVSEAKMVRYSDDIIFDREFVTDNCDLMTPNDTAIVQSKINSDPHRALSVRLPTCKKREKPSAEPIQVTKKKSISLVMATSLLHWIVKRIHRPADGGVLSMQSRWQRFLFAIARRLCNWIAKRNHQPDIDPKLTGIFEPRVPKLDSDRDSASLSPNPDAMQAVSSKAGTGEAHSQSLHVQPSDKPVARSTVPMTAVLENTQLKSSQTETDLLAKQASSLPSSGQTVSMATQQASATNISNHAELAPVDTASDQRSTSTPKTSPKCGLGYSVEISLRDLIDWPQPGRVYH